MLKLLHYRYLFPFVMLMGIIGCQQSTANEDSGLTPKQALATFDLRPNFKIQLVASEPHISDPVAMTIDGEGRLYVVEMHGYNGNNSSLDQVKLLRDTNGDGQFDKSAVFADSLRLPSGIMAWKRGVLVTAPPNIWYLADTTGDGHADTKRKMLTGFDISNAEADVNTPIYGLNNWIYAPNELASNRDIFYPSLPHGPRLPKDANGHDIRFRPDTHGLKMLSGRSQFGQTFDRWGHRFLVNNSNPIYQEVIANRYLQRNADLLVSNATQSLAKSRKVFPITRNPENQLLTDVGTFTAATAITAYEGGGFPSVFDSVIFVDEPADNLIRAFRLTNHGPTYVASPLRAHKEFLASTDAWFRPVNMYIGPDGALYVVDYYRQIIEGTDWLSKEVLESGNLYNGSHKGRIYRITPKGAPLGRWPRGLHLGGASDEQLVAKLADPNIWWRRNAQRLLVGRDDPKSVPTLEQMARNDSSAVGRLHALWTLQGMSKLRSSLIRRALQDSVAGIRENAIKLAELHLKEAPSLTKALLAMSSDPNAKVKFQLLCTLGYVRGAKSAEVRQKLLFRDIDNKWMQIAALSAPSSQNKKLLKSLLTQFKPSYSSLVQRLSAMAAANQPPDRVHRLLRKATRSGGEKGWQAPMIKGIASGLTSRPHMYSSAEMDERRLVQAFFEHPSAGVRQGSLQALQAIGLSGELRTQAMRRAARRAKNQNLASERQVEALHFLALADPTPYASLLKGLISPHEPTTVQIAAVHTLSAIPDTTVSGYVLRRWSELTSSVRKTALSTFVVRPFQPQRIALLLEAIRKGKIKPEELIWAQKVPLMRDVPDTLKKEAIALLARNRNKSQQDISKYVSFVSQKTGYAKKGRMIFLQNCAVCHQVGAASGGSDFGPNLATVSGWDKSRIITNIVLPNKSIAKGYSLWRVELKNGEVKQGIISTKTSSAITLRNHRGDKMEFSRDRIKSVKSLHVSPMPEDFKEKINPQEMADLVAFIRHTK